MLFECLERNKDVVRDLHVDEMVSFDTYSKIRGRVTLTDGSILHFRQTAVSGKFYKYAYHWSDVHDKIRCRWDNAPHWPDALTFPHHKHVGNEEALEDASEGGDFDAIFAFVANQIRTKRGT